MICTGMHASHLLLSDLDVVMLCPSDRDNDLIIDYASNYKAYN